MLDGSPNLAHSSEVPSLGEPKFSAWTSESPGLCVRVCGISPPKAIPAQPANVSDPGSPIPLHNRLFGALTWPAHEASSCFRGSLVRPSLGFGEALSLSLLDRPPRSSVPNAARRARASSCHGGPSCQARSRSQRCSPGPLDGPATRRQRPPHPPAVPLASASPDSEAETGADGEACALRTESDLSDLDFGCCG